MKIAVISPVSLSGIGGLERLNSDLISEWLNLGHEVNIVCKDEFRVNIRHLYKLYTQLLRSDVILVVQTNLFGILMSLPFLSKVFLQHNTDYFHESQRKGPRQLFGFLKLRILRHLRGIAVSNCVKERLCSNSVIVIPNPVPNPSFFNAEDEDFLRDLDIVFVGRLVHDKGVDLLIRALAAMDDDYTLTVVGSGNQKQSLVKLAKDYQVGERVHFIGPVDHKNVNQYLLRARVVAMPSRYEPFGLVAGEALASGATLVASNVDNLREMFFHADLSFEIEDLNDFVRALQIGLKLDRSDAIRISLKRIQNLNNLESVALRYLEYFQS